ncbi:MAG: autotransporter domain-containing protein, partial [Mailhella sp.]|nr:autotransporter domain-containing protein [Mailhella sp.]
ASTNKAVRGMFVSGGVSTTVGGDLAVDVTSTNNEAAGLHVQYGGKLVSDAGTSINVVAKGKTAYALSLVDYSGSTGSATFNGDVTLEAQGAKAEDSHAVYGTGSITNSGNFTVKSGLLSGFTGSYRQTKGTTAIGADSGFFGGKVTIADGILSVGDVDTSEAKGATVAIGAPVELGADTDMLVGTLSSQQNTGSKVEFGSGSMLIVDAEKLGGEAAFTGTGTTNSTAGGQEFHAAADSKLHILNAKAGQDIVIAQGFAKDVEEYSKNNVTFANPLLDPAQVAVKDDGVTTDGKVILTLGKSVKDPTEVYGDVDASNALVEVTQQGSDGIGGDMVQSFLNSGSRDASALNEVASAAVTAGVQNTALRLADAASNTVLNHMSLAQHDGTHAIHSGGVDFWATPMYGNLYTSGMAAPDASVRGQFGGLALGADLEAGHFLGGQFRLGAAIHGGGGQSEAKGTACSVQNDYDFGGVNLYAGWNSGAFNLIGSVGYAFGNHEVEMGLPFAGFGTAKADVDSTAFTADLRAEYQLKTDWVDVLPHVGVRYTALRTDGYDLKAGGVLNSVDRVTQNIVQFPIGVTLSKDFAFADWNVKPMVDVSFIPAVGDKDVETKVRFSGVNAVDSFDSRVMDSSSWAATMGVQAEKGDFSLGLNYGVQASSHETDQNIQLKLGWKF